MGSLRVYTQRILNDLKVASQELSDVELVSKQGKIVTNSLVLASLSGTLNAALGDLIYENVEERIKIIVPESEIEFSLVSSFFSDIVFSPDENLELDEKYNEVLDYLDIRLIETKSNVEEDKPAVVHVASSNFKHECQVCNKTFNLKKLLMRHIRTFHSENPYKCEECGRLCRSRSELQIHQRMHTKERPHKCSQCRRSFTQVSHLNEHVNNVHFGSSAEDRIDSKKICEICGLVLSSRGAVQRHMRSHCKDKDEQVPEEELIIPQETEDQPLEEASVAEEEEEEINQVQPKETGLICTVEGCGKRLKSQSSLKLHMNTHNSNAKERRPFTCQTCNRSFTQKSHLTVHLRVHSGAKPHMCSFCGRQFSVRSNLKKHLKMHEKMRIANETDEPLSSLLQLGGGDEEAMKENFGLKNSVNICEMCGRSFASMNDLEQHVKIHTHEKPFECLICLTSFETKSAMRIHEKIHTGEEQFVCVHCDLSCVSKSALDKHILIHTGEKPFDCPQCGKAFKQKSQVNYHVKTVHGVNPKDRPRNHVCFHCGSAFTTASTLRKHSKIHTDERPHACRFCGKRFIQKVHLQTHMLRHSGEKPWLCNVCGKGFVTNAVLKEHAKLHSTAAGVKKSYACHQCDAKYVNLADLQIHQRRHTGEMPFACDKCDKAFRSKRLLQEHDRTHLNVKPFNCGNCGKTFATASGLRQHFKRHDTCKLASLPGSFSLVEELGRDTGALLVDFLPQANVVNATVGEHETTAVQEDVILIDNQSFTLAPLT